MSLISGLLTVENAQTDDLVGEWQQHVTVRHAKGIGNGAYLFALMSKLRVETADNTEFHWFERDPVINDYYSSADVANPAATTLYFQLEDGGPAWNMLSKNSVLENSRTGEFVLVTADATSAAVSVSRGFADTTPAAVLNGDLWTYIAYIAEEGSDPTRAVYQTPEDLVNYIQTVNSTVFLSNAYKGSVLRTDLQGPLRERRLYALEKISGDIEKSFLIGRRARISGSNGYIYMTGGIRDSLERAGLTSNILDGNGASGVSLDEFLNWLRSFMVFGSPEKLAFCGPKAYSAVSSFANSAVAGFRIMNNETVFGMNITTIVTPYGILNLTFHPLLQECTAYHGAMFVIDLANIVQKTMERLFLQPEVQTPGQDAYKEQFRAKLGLKLKFAKAFGYAHDFEKLNVDGGGSS